MKKLLAKFTVAVATLFAAVSTTLAATNQVTVVWEANPPAEGVGLYKVYRSVAGSTNAPIVQSTTGTNLVSTNMFMGTTYVFTVTAVGPSLLESLPSDPLQFYMPFLLPEVKITNIVFGGKSGQVWNDVRVSWASLDKARYGFTTYTLNVDDLALAGGGNTFTTTNNSFTIPTLNVADYRLTVTTTNWHGTSPTVEAFISKNPPSKPRIFISQ